MHRLRRARAGVLASLLLVIATWVGLRGARAEPASLSLTWDAPAPDCPAQSYVEGAVAELLSGGPRPAARVEARATVSRGNGGPWRVRLVVVRDGATGERSLEASSCRSLADATALIVALTIDPARVAANRPSAAADAGGPIPVVLLDAGALPADAAPPVDATEDAADAQAPEAAAAPPAPPAVPPVAAPAPGPEVPSGPSATWRDARAAVLPTFGGDLGSLPTAGYGLSLAGAALFGSLRIEGYGVYWPAQPARAPSGQHGGGEVQLVAGGGRGCYVPLRGTFELGACAGLELGSMHGEGFGVRFPGRANSLWIAGIAGARGTLAIVGPLGLTLDLSVGFPFNRDQFVLDQIGTIHQASPIVGRGSLGPELRF